MRSKAHFKTHPIHPMLVSFPIALLTGSFFFDLTGWWFDIEGLVQSAFWMQIAGIGFGILAAIPGFIDYLYTVPPKSSGKKRAAMHGLINVITILLFTGIWLYRQEEGASFYIILSLELAGVLFLTLSGWMGGTLVFRNQIGVDQRYAGAGKWKDETFHGIGKVAVAKADELQVNQMKLLRVNKKRIVLARSEDGYAAFSDHCTHRGGSLAGGSMICGTVQCPWHGSQFDVRNGEVKAGPAKEPIRIYAVVEEGENVFLMVSADM